MQLSRARIANFRSLRDVTVEFGPHTAFIGGNGAGKSSILKAIERFYSTSKALDADDYFGRDQSLPVHIELTFSDLAPDELEQFEDRVRDGTLVVRRVFDNSVSSGRYHGLVLQNVDFKPIRQALSATGKRQAYKELRDNDQKYAGLPNAGSAAAVDDALRAWEADHADQLTLELDDGQFFGFQNAGRGALQRRTSFVFVPAVREALSDASDQKSSVVGRLIEVVVRSAILKRPEYNQFKEEMTARYKQIVSADNMPELKQLEGVLTGEIKNLYAEAEVGLNWREVGDLPVPLPAADVMLSDDGFGGPVDRQGHGLQRAFVITLLQHLATSSQAPPDPAPEDAEVVQHSAPSLILAIEEPELYQHPTKQRHFSKVLRALSAATLPGAGGKTQVAFASHSPLFVALPNADELRLVRREHCEGESFKHCVLKALDLDAVAARLEAAWEAEPGTFSGATLMPKLHILGPELAEGFFARGVVLVEGRSDRAAITAAAMRAGHDFEAAGIAILAVEGKPNLDRPLAIFRELGIPTYAIWDNDSQDKKIKKDHNLPLARLCSAPDAHVDQPSGTVVSASFAHFDQKLETTLREELGPDLYSECLSAACESLGLPSGKDQEKMPAVMVDLLNRANEKGVISPTLNALVSAIWTYMMPSNVPVADGETAETAPALPTA